MAMLEVKDLQVYYGMIQAIKGISFEVNQGEVIALIGANGAGKTTTLDTIAGLLRSRGGDIVFQGESIAHKAPHLIVKDGLALVPEGRRVFAQMTVEENLEMGAFTRANSTVEPGLEKVYELFPRLKERRRQVAGTLSGGEQTRVMLSALFAREDAYPLIDEPTNSLDAPGRAMLADYLRRKDGFLLVSHDRAFLNRAIDHVVCLNKANTYVMQGNYDTFEARLNGENEAEAARNETLRKEIKQLEAAARKTAEWSNRAEENKRHADKSFYGKVDRGFLGAASERMMKRSKASQVRQERAIEEKQTLLKNDLEPVGILCSHAHVDHCANNRYFQEKYHLPVALTAPEAGMCSSILNLKCYRLLVSPDAAEQEMSEMVHVPDLILPPVDGPIRLAGAMFRILHTPGHSSGHICAVTPDNVCYTGDALMSQALLDAKLPYGLSIQLAMESRERLRELEDCDFFIMAHKGVCAGREIGPLIDANQELVRRRAGEIRDLITEPMDFSQICRAVCTRFSLLTRRPRRALYYERNIRLFVEYLMDQGELGMETRQGTAFYLPSKKI